MGEVVVAVFSSLWQLTAAYSPVFRELVDAHVGMKSYVICVLKASNVGENDSLSLPNKPAVAHSPISRI